MELRSCGKYGVWGVWGRRASGSAFLGSAFIGAMVAAAIIGPTANLCSAAEFATGIKIGEVTERSAQVWVRTTAKAERNWDGLKASTPLKTEELLKTPADSFEGAAPGAEAEVWATLSWDGDGDAKGKGQVSRSVRVSPKTDYTAQFTFHDLKPATQYRLTVEARTNPQDEPTKITGGFTTAAVPDQWQDVRFAVITGQAYRDLDHREGYHIYPAMEKLKLHFMIPTGDTVYYDNDPPNARGEALARLHWQRMYSLPRHVALHRFTPGYWEKDDHDVLQDDCWPGGPNSKVSPLTFEDGLRIFAEQTPKLEKPYRTVRWGRGLQIWLVEGRDFRSSNRMPDGPDKTIWGKEQMAWLQQSILASDAAFRVLISPTPIVGPDRGKKADNHANEAFAHEGNLFRQWTKDQGLKNFFVCCGDRHWQYLSIDPKSGLHEFSCGPVSDQHAGGSPGRDPAVQPFHRVKGGFLTVEVNKIDGRPTAFFRHRDVHGQVVNEFQAQSP